MARPYASLYFAAAAVLWTLTGLALSPRISLASTSSWDSQPAWATPDPSTNNNTTQRRKQRDRYAPATDVSPFSPGSNNVSLDLGQVFLMGNLGNAYQSSIGTQVHYTYGVSDLFGFDSSIGYSDHSDGAFSMISALMGVRTNLAWYDKVVPYGVFGMGFYRPSFTVTPVGPNNTPLASQATSVSPLLFGVHLGPGVDLALSKQIFFGASLTFNDVFDNTQIVNGQPMDVGGTYTTFFIHAGVTF